jgi:hypothetical protein
MTLQPVSILFPDAEAWAVTALRAALALRSEAYKSGVVVDTKVPTTRPARLVTVRRDGGPARGIFDYPRFGVNVYAATEEDATDLSNLVAALMRRFPGDGTCVSIRQMSGPSPVPDESGTPRRYLVFEATLRGGVL